MPEADVLYSNVTFTKTKESGKETPSPQDESTYSEVKVAKPQPAAQQPDAQPEASSKGSRVTERASLLLLCALLAAAVIGLAFDHFQTKKNLHTIKKENEALRMNMSENLTKANTSTTAQPECVKPTAAVTSASCQKCREGWEQSGGSCYYFSSNKSSWNQSRDECRLSGGDLVKIDSREEQAFLENRMRGKMREDEDKFWIGLTDSKEEGEWLWVDNSPLNTSLIFWSSTEPDNWNRENPDGEDCVRMGQKAGAAVELRCWFDKSCNAAQRSICEKPAETGVTTFTCV